MPVEIKGLSFGYYPEKTVLNGIDVTCRDHRITGIIGPNGCGKTTLLKVMAGYLHPGAGTVLYDGNDIGGIRPADLARLRAVVEQGIECPFAFPVYDYVMLGRIAYRKSFRPTTEEDHRIVLDALRDTNALRFQDRKVTELSGGELQRVMIAKALAQKPKYLLLDEPTSHLDIRHQLDLMELLSRLSKEITVICILHEMNLAATWCDDIVLTQGGRIVSSGDADRVLSAHAIEEVFDVLAIRQKLPEAGRYQFSFSLPAADRDRKRCRVHVISGEGRGRIVFSTLASAGYEVSAGVLNNGDQDYDTAALMEIDLVSAPPFSAIGPDETTELYRLCDEADVIVLVAVNVGKGNYPNIEAAASFLGTKPVIFFNPDKNLKKLDHTDGRATALYDKIVGQAPEVSDIDGLFGELERVCRPGG
ncbi:MAG: ABC transporter ATP-binding protein [Methanomicrobiaceae archaeon]|nr:ABC transporter ATP-binding protein [Methanomicrobiaceae archaeon]